MTLPLFGSSEGYDSSSSSASPHQLNHHHHDLTTEEMITYACLSVVLVIGAGTFSGLTLAIFSIDATHLRVEARTGTPKEAKRAKRLLSLIDRHHLVLVTLLISNAACMTALPIFLEELLNPVVSLVVSITAVLFFGEVLPQATFVKYAVPVSNFFVPLVWFMMIVTFIVAYPFSKLLDLVVGHKHSDLMEREQLGAFFRMHAEVDGADSSGATLALSKSEVSVMQGALKMSSDSVRSIMKVPTADCFMLSSAQALDKKTICLILERGFSRIPIYKDDDRTHVLGCLLTKSLLPLAFKSPDPPPLCGEYPLREVVRASNEWLIEDLYAAFTEGQTHMAVVYNNRGRMQGIITLDDVFECLHSISLDDELDIDTSDPRRNRLLEVYSSVRQARGVTESHQVRASNYSALSVASTHTEKSNSNQPKDF